MTLSWTFACLSLLLFSASLLKSNTPKEAPVYRSKAGLNVLGNARDFIADPLRIIQAATRECGNVFRHRVFSVSTVWLRGNALNNYYLHMKEDVWSFAGGMRIFLDRLVDQGYWTNYKVLLASVSRYINRREAQDYVTQVTIEQTQRQAAAWAAHGREIMLFDGISELVHSVIVRSLMGEDFYRHHSDELLQLLHAMEADVGSPWNFLLPGWVTHPPARRLKAARERFKAIFHERLEGRANHEDQDGGAGSTGGPKDYVAFTMRDKLTAPLRELMPSHHTLLFFSAHTSTAASIAWNVVALLRHPDVLRRVKEELRENPNDNENFNEKEYPLLHACIKETSRYYCGMRLLRLARQDVHLPDSGSGYRVPQGSVVSISPFLTHHDPANYPRPQEWLPERWTASSSTSTSQESEESGREGLGRDNREGGGGRFMPFGAGSHRCVGEKMATIMVTRTLVTLLRTWDVEWGDEGVEGRTAFGGFNFDKIGSPWLRGDVAVRVRMA